MIIACMRKSITTGADVLSDPLITDSEEYEWEETDAPEYEFEKIDTETLGEGPWYTCDQFIADNYPTVDLHYSVFDGERIVFDFTQY